jgi:fructose-1,6-bisphosphatase
MRFLLGAVVGGAVVYFCDPQEGAARRARLRELWERNQEPLTDIAESAGQRARQASREVGDLVGDRIGSARGERA